MIFTKTENFEKALALSLRLTAKEIEWPERVLAQRQQDELVYITTEIITKAKALVRRDILEEMQKCIPLVRALRYNFEDNTVYFEGSSECVLAEATLSLTTYTAAVKTKIVNLGGTPG